jgi:hypothetical protein
MYADAQSNKGYPPCISPKIAGIAAVFAVKTFRYNAIVHWGDTDPARRRTRGHTPLYIPHNRRTASSS